MPNNALPNTTSPTARNAACAHCGLPVPPGLIEPDAEQQFCCHACETVHHMIRSCGLDAFYATRNDAPWEQQKARTTDRTYREFDDDAFLDRHAHPQSNGLLSAEFYLEGVHCAACVWLVEKLPSIQTGVIEARLNYRRQTARVVWDPAAVRLSAVAQKLDQLGYPVHPLHDTEGVALRRLENRKHLIRIAIGGACAGNAMLAAIAMYAGDAQGMTDVYRDLLRYTSMAIGWVALLWPGMAFFRGAAAALRARVPHMDLPIALGLGAGGLAGTYHTLTGTGDVYFDSLATLVFLLLVGRYLQYQQQRRADDRLSSLFALTPRSALRVEGDAVAEVPVEALRVADLVDVPTNASVPVDGIVVRGESALDAALLTGESKPAPIGVGDTVSAGAVNALAPIRVRVEAAGDATRLGKLIELVTHAAHSKPHIVQFADRISGWFVVVVSLIAVVTAVAWWPKLGSGAVDHAVALLIVACPCALGLATPLALAVALGRAAHQHILIKSGQAVEALAKPGVLVLDKTGTLTRGRLSVTEWRGDGSLKPLVAAIETRCDHPTAAALAEAYDDGRPHDAQITDRRANGIEGVCDGRTLAIGSVGFMHERGRAISHEVQAHVDACLAATATPVLVAVDGAVAAVVGVGDTLRDDTPQAIERLRQLGWRPVIASGDHPSIVRHIAEQLGIDASDAHGGVSPHAKLAMVNDLSRDHHVAMAGDGVNDAAALAAAPVGLAVHGGAEAALAAADVYFASPGLSHVVRLITGARRTLTTIRVALGVSLSYNAAAVALAAAGVIGPLVAAVLMPISSFTVVLIALSARTFKEA